MSSPNFVRAGGFIYLSGMAATDVRGDVAAQTRGVLERARDVLAGAGSSLDQIVSVLVILKAASDFPAMNDVYRAFWTKDFPARTTVVTEPSSSGAAIEMSIVAAEGGADRVAIHPRDWIASPSPYSYAIKSGDTVFLSGLVSRDGRDNSVVTGDVGAQTKVILDAAGELLKAAGLSHANVVSSRVYIPDVASFKPMNEVYRTYFPSAPPARATVQTALAGPQYSVEMTFVASSSAGRRAITEGLPPNMNLPLSAAMVAGNHVYLSGALGNDDTNRGNAAAQTRATLDKLRRTLAAAGALPKDVVESFVYVTDLGFLADVDREYRAFFGSHTPARTTLRSGLVAPDGLVEILLTAVKR
jgi:enamine deaminase RidA (YjgF/YER057c/UK114 family)